MGKKDPKEKTSKRPTSNGSESKSASKSSPNWLLLFGVGVCCLALLAYVVHRSRSPAAKPEIKFPFPPDSRPKKCPKSYKFDPAVSKVSVIIIWHNEKWEHMEGTLSSLLYFTDDSLVEEYLFVSDGNADNKEKELSAMSKKVRVFSFPERQGLILAKMKGAELAKAPVLVFLEAHCIVNRQWLPPLLEELTLKPKALVMPVLDIIPQEDWTEYHANSGKQHWRYEWNLNLVATNPSKEQMPVQPYTSPGTSGGILAMRTDWFRYLKFWDPGMLQWGGDHFELSHKVWRCGGLIEMVPCSRIGHLFREPAFRPYPVDTQQVVQNYKRLAEVWMPDHLDYFYRMKPEAVEMSVEGIAERHKEAAELGCKNMSWYLDNIDHEMRYEMDHICHPFVSGSGQCEGRDSKLVPGRWTITWKGLMPVTLYKKKKKEADKRLKAVAEAAQKAGEL